MKHLLRPLVGVARFRRSASIEDAADTVFNCWTLVKWVYEKKKGIVLPDFPTEQREFARAMGRELKIAEIDTENAIVFRTSRLPKFLHPGIATGDGSIIHAVNNGEVRARYGKGGVFEEAIENFVDGKTFRGAYIL